jgi:hypothetical protein
MTTVFDSAVSVKSARPDHAFGARLYHFVPFAVTAFGFVPPNPEDETWAAAKLNEPEPDWDALAAEALWQQQYDDLTPPPGCCRSCGQPTETNKYGLCDGCEDKADAMGDSRY